MLREFVDRILELSNLQRLEFDGQLYVDKNLKRIDPPRLEALQMTTLDGFISYVRGHEMSNFLIGEAAGARNARGGYMVQVLSPTTVRLVTGLRSDGSRDVLAVAEVELRSPFPFGKAMGQEEFIISLKRSAVHNVTPADDYARLLQLVGTIHQENIDTLKDTGISQQVATRQGVEVALTDIPPFLRLTFRRTFPEIEDQSSEFFLRIKAGQQPILTLAESTPDEWELRAKKAVRAYLAEQLAGGNTFISVIE